MEPISYYVTKNRITPYAGLYGQWKRGNFRKACGAGCKIYTRNATPEETEAYADRMKELGFGFPNLTAMIREVSCVEGKAGRKRIVQSIRKNKLHIEACLREVQKKADKHEAKKLANKVQREKNARSSK